MASPLDQDRPPFRAQAFDFVTDRMQPASAGPLSASGVGELHASDQPNHEENDQDEAKSPTEPRPAIAIIAVGPAPAAKQQDQQDDNEDCAHGSPFVF